jgi:hypothetical protein
VISVLQCECQLSFQQCLRRDYGGYRAKDDETIDTGDLYQINRAESRDSVGQRDLRRGTFERREMAFTNKAGHNDGGRDKRCLSLDS